MKGLLNFFKEQIIDFINWAKAWLNVLGPEEPLTVRWFLFDSPLREVLLVISIVLAKTILGAITWALGLAILTPIVVRLVNLVLANTKEPTEGGDQIFSTGVIEAVANGVAVIIVIVRAAMRFDVIMVLEAVVVFAVLATILVMIVRLRLHVPAWILALAVVIATLVALLTFGPEEWTAVIPFLLGLCGVALLLYMINKEKN